VERLLVLYKRYSPELLETMLVFVQVFIGQGWGLVQKRGSEEPG
jgi:hypothetical protein